MLHNTSTEWILVKFKSDFKTCNQTGNFRAMQLEEAKMFLVHRKDSR